MEEVTKYLLRHCVYSLVEVQRTLKNTLIKKLISKATGNYNKQDALYLDVLPENVLNRKIIREYDSSIVLITEEKGEFNFNIINKAEFVVFADPTDRSKYLKHFLEYLIKNSFLKENDTFESVFNYDNMLSDWEKISGKPASLSGACSSITVVKRGSILFSLVLNYITEEIFIACEDFVSYLPINQLSKDNFFSNHKNITFCYSNNKSYVTYLGKKYREYLQGAHFLDDTYSSLEDEPGGPLRILYLSELTETPASFILSNGEKIGEWLGWLAYCSFSKDLIAYSIYPGTFFARDDLLMTPSPPYSILEVHDGQLKLNFNKLRYIKNPSRYREMILVTHRKNVAITSMIEAIKSRALFPEK